MLEFSDSLNRRLGPRTQRQFFCDTAKFFVLLQTEINQQNTSCFLRQNSKKVKL